MKIHALTTGAVRVKHSLLFPSSGLRRQLDLFTPVLTHAHGDHIDGLE
jgi:phosphoribosyl 1,2-cyclic phosphodiesterase